VDPESAALASTAAATMVTLLTTDAWVQVKKEIGGLWRRFRPSRAEAVEADLEEAREQALAAVRDEAAIRLLTAEWESRLKRLLAADAAAAAELARVTDTLVGLLPQGMDVRVAQHANASDHSTVIQVGGNARIGKPC